MIFKSFLFPHFEVEFVIAHFTYPTTSYSIHQKSLATISVCLIQQFILILKLLYCHNPLQLTVCGQ